MYGLVLIKGMRRWGSQGLRFGLNMGEVKMINVVRLCCILPSRQSRHSCLPVAADETPSPRIDA